LFETIAIEYHHPRLLRVGGVDEHALGHSGVTPGRAPAAARKSAGGAILWARKPAAPGVVPSSKDWTLAMTGLVRRAGIGFGFLRCASPGAAALRGGKRAADHARRSRTAAPGTAPGRRTAVFRSANLQRKAARDNGFLSWFGRGVEGFNCAEKCRCLAGSAR